LALNVLILEESVPLVVFRRPIPWGVRRGSSAVAQKLTNP